MLLNSPSRPTRRPSPRRSRRPWWPRASTGFRIGAQSFDAAELQARPHAPARGSRRDRGQVPPVRRPTQISLDLIFGIPGQTPASWLGSLRTAIDLQPDHLSCYGLTYEPGTPLHERLDAGRVATVDADLEADMYEATLDARGRGLSTVRNQQLRPAGPRVSAQPALLAQPAGIGIGPVGGELPGRPSLAKRARHRDYVRLMQQGESPAIDSEELSPTERAGRVGHAESSSRRMASVAGRSRRRPASTRWSCLPRPIRVHTAAGLLAVDADRIALTRRGRLLADAVIADFLRP